MHYLAFLLLLSSATAINITSQTALSLSFTKPVSAAYVKPDFAGLSIEADRFVAWAGNLTHPNNYTWTLLNNLKERQGKAPSIRVGGGTEDGYILVDNVTLGYNEFLPVPAPVNLTSTKQLFPQAYFTGVGKEWYLTSGNLPEGTDYTWGVNFRAANISETVNQILALRKAFDDPRLSHVNLKLVEIGNEADLWAGTWRPANWSIGAYADQQVEYITAVNQAVGDEETPFQIGSIAGQWQTKQLLATEIFNTKIAKQIHSVAEHRYQVQRELHTCTATSLIDHYSVTGNLTYFGTASDIVHELPNEVEFYIGETSSFWNHGQAGVSNAAAAAIWAVDYILQAATLGIDGLRFHNGVGYNYSLFEPIDFVGPNIEVHDPNATRHILPLYNAFLVIAEVIGTSKNTYVNEFFTPYSWTLGPSTKLAAYQVWEGETLKKIVLINGVPWTDALIASGIERPGISIDLSCINTAKLKRLSISSLDATEGVTWGGQSWENYDGLATGQETFESFNGTLVMEASEVVVLFL